MRPWMTDIALVGIIVLVFITFSKQRKTATDVMQEKIASNNGAFDPIPSYLTYNLTPGKYWDQGTTTYPNNDAPLLPQQQMSF